MCGKHASAKCVLTARQWGSEAASNLLVKGNTEKPKNLFVFLRKNTLLVKWGYLEKMEIPIALVPDVYTCF